MSTDRNLTLHFNELHSLSGGNMLF